MTDFLLKLVSVSHTKASVVGSTISIPITNGELNLGTWQGIYLTEVRTSCPIDAQYSST